MLRLSFAVLACACALSLSALGATAAMAQDAERDPEAHGLFLAGQAAYDAGRFEDALRYFQQSYELSPRPALLYNIGQAADRARLDEVALDAFRRYLASSSELPEEDRRRVEVRIHALEAALARGEHAAPEGEPDDEPTEPQIDDPPRETHEPEPVPPSSGPDAAGLGLVISGGALLAVGAILAGVGAPDTGALASPRMDETYPQAQSRQDTGSALVASGLVSLGIGAVLGVIGVVLLAGSPGSGEHARLGPGGLEVTF